MTFLPLALLLAALAGAAQAQDARCARLEAQLRAIDRAGERDPARVARYQDAIDRQIEELRRTQDYASSIGCDSGLFGAPPQCRGLDANIQRMQRNLRQLQNQFSRLSDNLGAQREAERQRTLGMLASLDCNGVPSYGQPGEDETRTAGMFEQLFGPDEMQPPSLPEPSYDQQAALPEEQAPSLGALPRGNNLRTICVRACDGYFFPISFSTNAGSFAADAETCRRQCPGTKVELYAYDTFSQQAEDAVSTASGARLSDMPNAFKFRTSFDQACTCGKAKEAVLPQSQASAGEALKRLDEDALPKKPGATAKPGLDVVGRPRTATVESLPTTEGTAIETTNPDGTKKRVRVITPGLMPTQ